ncbi:MAG: SET domain-containing protein [Rhodovibrionaceae bacterium]
MIQILRKLSICKYLYLGDAGVAGIGVFAAKPFVAGTVIVCDEDGDYYDEIFSRSELIERRIDIERFAFQIAVDSFILPNGNIDDFINHSCRPNAGIRLTGKGYKLISIEDINKDDQICYDYSTYMFDNNEQFKCHCRSNNCRGHINSFYTLDVDLREKYIASRVVAPQFLK